MPLLEEGSLEMVFTLKNKKYGLFQFKSNSRSLRNRGKKKTAVFGIPRLSWSRCGYVLSTFLSHAPLLLIDYVSVYGIYRIIILYLDVLHYV